MSKIVDQSTEANPNSVELQIRDKATLSKTDINQSYHEDDESNDLSGNKNPADDNNDKEHGPTQAIIDEERGKNYWKRLDETYTKSFLFYCFMQQFSGGWAYGARNMCKAYLFKEYFKLQPSEIQRFDAGSQWFILINVLVAVVIDMKILRRRKWVCVFCCFFAAFVNGVMIWSDSIPLWFWAIAFDGFLGNFRCTIFNAWMVEQARKDVKYGSGDLQSFLGISGQIGGTGGTLIATYMIDQGVTRHYFYLCFVCQLVMMTGAIFVDREIDTNKFVSHKDSSMIAWEQEQRQLHPERYRNGQPVEPPNYAMRFCMKLSASFKILKNPVIYRFLLYFFLVALCTPMYMAYDYVYAMDYLKIPLTLMNTSGLIVGQFGFIFPWVYQKYLKDKDYKVLYGIGQAIYVFAGMVGIVLVSGAYEYLHIPKLFLFLLCGAFAGTLEGSFIGFPTYIIFMKLIPIGIEGTIMCIYTTYTGLCNVMFREYMGIFVNDAFLNLTNENMDNYLRAQFINLGLYFIPLILIFKCNMIPTLAQADELQKQCAELNDRQQELERQATAVDDGADELLRDETNTVQRLHTSPDNELEGGEYNTLADR